MRQSKLDGPAYLALNRDIANRSFDREKALEALRGLRSIATDLGLPGNYLADSISRFLDRPQDFPSLDSAFGLRKAAGGQRQGFSVKEAKVAYQCLEQRLSGALAKQVEVEGYSLRALQRIQEQYRIESIEKARRKRGKRGFNKIESTVINRLLSRGRYSVSKIIEEEERRRQTTILD
jgi:hypothetical protein